MLAGAAARCSAALVLYPFDLVKTRLQYQSERKGLCVCVCVCVCVHVYLQKGNIDRSSTSREIFSCFW
ncbi:MAG: MC/SLC25 family protein [Runella zeae]